MTFQRQTKVLGPYENTDVITFPNCSTLVNSNNERNPLTFIVPTNQWSAGVSIYYNNRLCIVMLTLYIKINNNNTATAETLGSYT